MTAHSAVLLVVCCLPILFGCAKHAGDEAARLAAAGSTDMAVGKYDDAYVSLRQAADLQPDVAEYHIGAGMAAAKLGSQAEAAEQYTAAEQVLARESQHDPERVDDLAMVLVLLGRSAEATQVLKEGAERFPASENLRRLASDPASLVSGLQDFSVRSTQPEGGASGK